MPHSRKRHALAILKKKLKFSRVATIQGARQCGKSFLARELLEVGHYETFDRARVKEEAEKRIGSFLEELQVRAKGKTIVLDEAQKVTKVFDEIKAIVDENSKPGQFLLLGSTEFSIENEIKESLTGRISRTRLFPMTASETFNVEKITGIDSFWTPSESSISRSQLIQYLNRGGFPAIFAIRDENERIQRIDEWLRTTVERDVLQIKKLKPDSSLCALIFQSLPFLNVATVASLSKELNRSPKRIQTQLRALSQVFAIHALEPYPLGTGKTRYLLIDPSLASFYEGSFYSKLSIAIITEFFAKQSYLGISPCRFYFYRSSKGSLVPLVIELGPKKVIALSWTDRESVQHQDVQTLKALEVKLRKKNIESTLILLAGVRQKTKVDGVPVLPWEFVF
jgi:predicted AAA+ superfamily ATPase